MILLLKIEKKNRQNPQYKLNRQLSSRGKVYKQADQERMSGNTGTIPK